MHSANLDIVIIGGSLAGLFAAVSLRSLSNVSKITILERYLPDELQDLGAGIRCNEEANDAILTYTGVSPEKYGSYITSYRMLGSDGEIFAEQPTKTWTTTWAQLYRTLREVVDADSKCSYQHGCTLADLRDTKHGKVEVVYQGRNHENTQMLADLVVGADGASSKARSLMDINGTHRTSAGYVCYRGVIPERELSPAAAELFHEAGTFSWPKTGQFVSYVVPSNEGPADQAPKCINWVWYRNKTEDELRELMTDTSGKQHKFTLPHGKVKPIEIEKIKMQAQEELPVLHAEVVAKTLEPFVQVVTDSMASKTSFLDGKLLLVGDAVGGQRPHTASAILQGTYHALLIRQHLENKLEMSELEQETSRFSRILVEGGQNLGKQLMSSDMPGPEKVPTFMKTMLTIQTEINTLWKQRIGIGDAEARV